MNIEYVKRINKLKCKPQVNNLQNVVYEVNWTLTGINPETGLSFSFYRDDNLTNPSQENFIPFEQLTEEIVLDWIMNTLGAEGYETCTNYVYTNLYNLVNPEIIDKPLPWVSSSLSIDNG